MRQTILLVRAAGVPAGREDPWPALAAAVFPGAAVRQALLREVPAVLAVQRGPVQILPLLLRRGQLYRALCRQAARPGITIAPPLLDGPVQTAAVLRAAASAIPRAAGEALVLAVHGAPGDCLDDLHAAAASLEAVFVGSLRCPPGPAALLATVRAAAETVVLAPLLLAAGQHAQQDLAGPGGWQMQFRQAGLPARVVLRGLEDSAAVRALWAARWKEGMA